MRFNYGSFFGLSAVHLMFMTQKDIDIIFPGLQMKGSIVSLIKNLYSEVCALKTILDPTSENRDMPRVICCIDTKSIFANNLVNGINWYLYKNNLLQENSVQVEQPAEASVTSEGDLDSLFEGSDATSVFVDDLDSLGAEKDDNLLDLDSLVESGPKDISEGIDVSYLFETDPVDLNNLAEYGAKHEQCPSVVLEGPEKITRFVRDKGKNLPKDVKDAIIAQASKMRVPQQCFLPRCMEDIKAPLSNTSLQILDTLYAKAYEVIEGETTRIDYIIQKLGAILDTSVIQGRNLFFQTKGRFSGGDIEWRSYLKICDDICNNYLAGVNRNIVKSNITALLSDCDLTLGRINQNDLNTLDKIKSILFDETSSDQVAVDLVIQFVQPERIASIDGDSILRPFVSRLCHNKDIFKQLLRNPEGLRYTMQLYVIVEKVIIKEMYSTLNLGDYMPQDISIKDMTPGSIQDACSDVFISFTRETGICGLYTQFDDAFWNIMRVMGNPLVDDNSTIFKPGTRGYRFSSLLKKNLRSLQSRIGG